jgi:general secretion pathway protein K
MKHRVPRGAALIVAMLIAALAATVAISLAANQQQWFASVAQRRDQVQAQALAQAGVQWARQILFEDARTSANIDFLGEPWALPLPSTPIEDGSIEGRIVDAQGLLNVNNLASRDAPGGTERRRFEHLFARLGLPVPALDAITDWIDADSVTLPAGAEDAWYAQQPSPMLAANAPLVRIAELAVVRGMSPEAVRALSPFVVALPANAYTPLNVNTAPPAVLAAAVTGLSDAALPGMIADRARKPYSSVAEFRTRLPQGASVEQEAAYDVKSSYFLVTVRARQGTSQANARALLKRSGGGWPAIVWQTLE